MRALAGGESRAQLVVSGGIVLAVMFVALALLVNTTLFVEHESQASAVGTSDPAVVAQEFDRTVADGLVRVNDRHAVSYPALTENLSAVVDSWERQVRRQRAPQGTSVTVEVRAVTRGSRLVADEDGRNLTSANADDDWTLATDVRSARESRLELDGTGLVTRGNPGVFRMVVDNGSDRWELTVANASDGSLPLVDDSSDVVANVTTPTGTATCTTSTRPVTVDLTGGELNGASCPELDFTAAVAPPYEIRIENGTNATGTYTLTVQNGTALPMANYNDSGAPRADPLLYGVTTDLRYEESAVEYRTTGETTLDET